MAEVEATSPRAGVKAHMATVFKLRRPPGRRPAPQEKRSPLRGILFSSHTTPWNGHRLDTAWDTFFAEPRRRLVNKRSFETPDGTHGGTHDFRDAAFRR